MQPLLHEIRVSLVVISYVLESIRLHVKPAKVNARRHVPLVIIRRCGLTKTRRLCWGKEVVLWVIHAKVRVGVLEVLSGMHLPKVRLCCRTEH
jgi:hypothetical protein